MKIFLVGLPGAGKSTIAKKLSDILVYRLIDTDDEICKSEKSTIEEIFKSKGEAYFRICEKNTLTEVIREDNIIVSTGGGLPCFHDNMKTINENGVSIFLNVLPDLIVDRLWSDRDHNRPMIQGKNQEQLLQFLKSKYEDRLPYYSQATIEVNGDNIDAVEIVEKLKLKKII